MSVVVQRVSLGPLDLPKQSLQQKVQEFAALLLGDGRWFVFLYVKCLEYVYILASVVM